MNRPSRFPLLMSTVVVLALLGASGCTVQADESLCREPSDDCPCESSDAPTDDSVTILTDGNYDEGINDLVDDIIAARENDIDLAALGVDGDAAVTLATYDAMGDVTSLGRFILGGVGSSPERREASASLNAACLQQIAVPEQTDGDLLRALDDGIALALAGEPRRAALIAVGLGRSDGEALPPLEMVDLSTPELRSTLVDTFVDLGYIRPTTTPRIVFWRPSDGVQHPVAAEAIEQLATHELCGVIGNCGVPDRLDEGSEGDR